MVLATGDGAPLFAYGSLMFPAVIRPVIGRVPECRSALAKGYSRLAVRGQSFPGLVRANAGSAETVEGVVYTDITREEWQRLVAFEDEFYELSEVAVECSGEILKALAFLIPPSRRSLLSDEIWQPERFRENLVCMWADCERHAG